MGVIRNGIMIRDGDPKWLQTYLYLLDMVYSFQPQLNIWVRNIERNSIALSMSGQGEGDFLSKRDVFSQVSMDNL